MSYFDSAWPPYVSVAERRRQAEREAAKLRKKGKSLAPVTIEGRTIATTFWGKSWCMNLERYSDYENRVPRGRTYVRNGSVVDLQVAKGEVTALVAGSSLYKIKISIAAVKPARWKAICRDCAGSIDSLVELLQGRLATGVMARVCQEGDGLFPSPDEIKLSCSCPDWADMCKHVAAALYGVGARLDKKPQLLFVLRGVDENELVAGAGRGLAQARPAPKGAKVLKTDDVGALFGLEMSEPDSGNAADTNEAARKPRKATSGPRGKKAAAAKLPRSPKISAAKSASGQRADKNPAGSRKAATNAGKRRAQPRLQPSA